MDAEGCRPSPRKRGRKSKVELAAASRHFLLARQKQQEEQRARAQQAGSGCADDGTAAREPLTAMARRASVGDASLSAPDRNGECARRSSLPSSLGFGPFVLYKAEHRGSACGSNSGAPAEGMAGPERMRALSDLRPFRAGGSGGGGGLTPPVNHEAQALGAPSCEPSLPMRRDKRQTSIGGLRPMLSTPDKAGDTASGAHAASEGRFSREDVWCSIQRLRRETKEALDACRTQGAPSLDDTRKLWRHTAGPSDSQEGGLCSVEHSGVQQAKLADDPLKSMGETCEELRGTHPREMGVLMPRTQKGTGENMDTSLCKERAGSSTEGVRKQVRWQSSPLARAGMAGNGSSGVTSTSCAAGAAPQSNPLPLTSSGPRRTRQQEQHGAGCERLQGCEEDEDSEGCGRVPLWDHAQEGKDPAAQATLLPGSAAMARRTSLEAQLLQLLEEQQRESLHLAGLCRRHPEVVQNQRSRTSESLHHSRHVAHGPAGHRVQPGAPSAPLATQPAGDDAPTLALSQRAMPLTEGRPWERQASARQCAARELNAAKAQMGESSASESHESMLLRAATAAIGAAIQERNGEPDFGNNELPGAARPVPELGDQRNEKRSSMNPAGCVPPALSCSAVPALAWMVQSLMDKTTAGSLQIPGEGAGESSPATQAGAGATPVETRGRAALLDTGRAHLWPPPDPVTSPLLGPGCAAPPHAGPVLGSPRTGGGVPALARGLTPQALQEMASMASLQDCCPLPVALSHAPTNPGQLPSTPGRRHTRFTPAGMMGLPSLPIAGLAEQGVPQRFTCHDWGLPMPLAKPAGPFPAIPALGSQQLQMLGWALSQQSLLGSSVPGSGQVPSLGLPSPWTLLGVPGLEPWSSLGQSGSHDAAATLSNIMHHREGLASFDPASAPSQVDNQPRWKSQLLAGAGQHAGGLIGDGAEARQSKGTLSRTQSLEECEDLHLNPHGRGHSRHGSSIGRELAPHVGSSWREVLEEELPDRHGEALRDQLREEAALQGGPSIMAARRKRTMARGGEVAANKSRRLHGEMRRRVGLRTPELEEGRGESDEGLGRGRGMSPGLDLELHL